MSVPFSPKTTAPGAADTREEAGPAPQFAFVLLWSASQPQNTGWTAFFPAFEWRYIGRGDIEKEKFAHFGPHRPGEPLVAPSTAGFLGGDTISRRQLRLRATAVALEMEKVGNCVTLVNGKEVERASLQPGDLVLLRKEALLLVVRRPLALPRPGGPGPLHRFGEPDAAGIVGESPAAWLMRELLWLAATNDEHVLIQGETGSGKELAARAIHDWSRRAKGPYVAHNMAIFTLTLLESALFGNVAGYPNPGMAARPGLFFSADHGTLFLDEIGECPPEAQAMMLRALELGACTPVGESLARRIDVRVIAATHQNDSRFRRDFRARFLRDVLLPALRERQEDIPLLMRHLLRLRAQKDKKVERFFHKGPSGELLEPRISVRLVEHLVRHPLPDNVRGLNRILGKAIDASPGDELSLPASMKTEPPPAPAPEQAQGRAEGEPPSKAELLSLLEQEEWNASRVARRLGVDRKVVNRLMEKYGIRRDKATG
jgi:two-component system nitrogen regulation response regulator GlnG/two-component system response regulator HydG